MPRLFNDRGMTLRSWISVAVLIGAVIWGGVEIMRAVTGASDETGYLFGLGFLGASAYGLYRMLADTRDTILRIEADFASGQSVISLWRPWGPVRLAAPLAALSNWRMYVSMRRKNQPVFLLMVDHPSSPRPLQIDLAGAVKDLDGLRRVAPEAIEEFEIRTGKRRAD
jgi:hypothetical protein